ncbi:MAG: ABC transporter permease [Clostridia bacterium]|nr:ABC transporter permease [Clostridia bacterium]
MKTLFSGLRKTYIGLILALLYSPVVLMIVLSFSESKTKWTGFSLVKYQALFQNERVMDAFITSILLALLSAAVATVLGTVACIGLLAMKKRLRSTVNAVANIPLLNADIVTGFSLMLFFAAIVGRMSHATLFISHVTLVLPYVVLNVYPKLCQFDRSIYDAALDLGASPVQAFFKVLLPDVFPGLLTGFLLALTISMDDFTITYFTKGRGLDTLSTYIYNTYHIKGILPEYYALATILFVGVLLMILLIQAINVRSAARGVSAKAQGTK